MAPQSESASVDNAIGNVYLPPLAVVAFLVLIVRCVARSLPNVSARKEIGGTVISKALRLIRVFHDLKQTELAEKIGVSKSYLSEIESGKKIPTLDVIEKYSKEFNLPSSSILFFSEKLDNEVPASMVARNYIASKVLSMLDLIDRKAGNIENEKSSVQD